jgi:hypothetical protein
MVPDPTAANPAISARTRGEAGTSTRQLS